jgi:xanthine dehydrogenase YagS FAD-binding subunit
MRRFHLETVSDLRAAELAGRDTQNGPCNAPVQYLAGGTTLVDLMKLDVLTPERVVNLGSLAKTHGAVRVSSDGLRIGAFAKMSAVAEHPLVKAHYPVIAQSLQLAASQQLRNMASVGGNVLQRTRCVYFRDTSFKACNKRTPGSGCAALEGVNRNHAVLGVDGSCIAQYPGDFAVALAALGADVELTGASGNRRIAFTDLHRLAAGRPHVETTLRPGEIITAINVPAGPWTARSVYVKVRDRASYEFAIASAAVALALDGAVVREVRIGVGGMAYKPWRGVKAEERLVGQTLNEATAHDAAEAVFADAVVHGGNAYKPELGRRTLVRALLAAQALEA